MPNIGKPSDKASGDCGRNPLGAGAILALSITVWAMVS
jgi:hypothetical protein